MSLVSEIKRYQTDWITAGVIAFVFVVYLELAPAHGRQFIINDPRITHSFANPQIINDFKLYVLVFVIPIAIIISLTFFKNRANFLRLGQLSVLGLVSSFVITGFLTDLLKIWISRPRPDFVTRCQPATSTPTDTYVTLDVCTQQNRFILNDGLKSCPSGHSSLSMAGALFLCFWLNGQYKLFRRATPLYIQLLSWSYLLVAFFIAISRHLDYRHHLEDILFGLFIGGAVSSVIYFRYFPELTSEDSDIPRDEPSILP